MEEEIDIEEVFKKDFELTGYQLFHLLRTFSITNISEYLGRDMTEEEVDLIDVEAMSILSCDEFMLGMSMIRRDTTLSDVEKIFPLE